MPLLLASALLLSACGSNAPPPPSSEDQGMAMPAPTGNQDRDFARAMIVHHQGAIDLARVQQARGSDPGLRRMANEIIAAQEREIAVLNAYLDRTGGR
jgi:uncharacterized protein (DUF305 family)